MSKFTLTDSQLEQLLAKFDLNEIKTAMNIISSIEEAEPEASPWQQLKKEMQGCGQLPEDDKKGNY